MAVPKKPLPLPVPSSSTEIELPLSSTWRQADGRRPTPQGAPLQVPVAVAKAQEPTLPKTEPPKLLHPVAPPAPPKEAAASAKPKDSAQVVFGHSTCPKCGHVQAPAKACAYCGLLFANWRPGMEAKRFAELPPEIVATLTTLWESYLNAQEEAREEAITRFHQFAAQTKATRFSGDVYRRHLAQNPDDALAAKWRERLIYETQLLLPTPQEKHGKGGLSRRAILIGLAVGFVLTMLSAYVFSTFMKR